MTTFIYALKEPDTGAIRYIGKTDDPKKRMRTHLATRTKCHRADWIQSLIKRGTLPVMEVIDEVPFSEWPAWEVAYIQFFKDEGCDLTNGTFGGDCYYPTEEVCRKHSESKRGTKNPMFGKPSWNRGKGGYKNPEQSSRMRGNCFVGRGSEHHAFGKPAWNRGLKSSPRTGDKLRESHLGQKAWNVGMKMDLSKYPNYGMTGKGSKLRGKKQPREHVRKRVNSRSRNAWETLCWIFV